MAGMVEIVETLEQKLKRHEDALVACMAEIERLQKRVAPSPCLSSMTPTFSLDAEALAQGRFDICYGPIRCFEGQNARERLRETASEFAAIQAGAEPAHD